MPNDRLMREIAAVLDLSWIQSELDEAAASGFRVLMASAMTGGPELVLFLERMAQPPETYKYQLLATTKTSTMERELNTTAAGGFRLLPRTLAAKEAVGLAGLFGGGRDPAREIVVVMERPPKANTRYEYRLLAMSKDSALQKKVDDATAQGFVLVGLVNRDENMVILEKELAQK